MNFKKLLLGSLFIVLSSAIYEIDKALSYYEWATKVTAMEGGYELHPSTISLSDNYFILLFLIIGVTFYIDVGFTFYKKNKVSTHQ